MSTGQAKKETFFGPFEALQGMGLALLAMLPAPLLSWAAVERAARGSKEKMHLDLDLSR